MTNIDATELIKEVEKQYPRELTICFQAVKIRHLQQRVNELETVATPEPEEE